MFHIRNSLILYVSSMRFARYGADRIKVMWQAEFYFYVS